MIDVPEEFALGMTLHPLPFHPSMRVCERGPRSVRLFEPTATQLVEVRRRNDRSCGVAPLALTGPDEGRHAVPFQRSALATGTGLVS
jgi:hypothetical protein